MITYDVDYTYAIREVGNTSVKAINKEDAEYKALQEIKEDWPEAFDIEITEVKEVI